MVDIYSWHPWFAWYPIRVTVGKRTRWVWFTSVLRKWNHELYYSYDFHGASAIGGWEYLL